MGSRDETQIVRLAGRCLYSLSHFADLNLHFNNLSQDVWWGPVTAQMMLHIWFWFLVHSSNHAWLTVQASDDHKEIQLIEWFHDDINHNWHFESLSKLSRWYDKYKLPATVSCYYSRKWAVGEQGSIGKHIQRLPSCKILWNVGVIQN